MGVWPAGHLVHEVPEVGRHAEEPEAEEAARGGEVVVDHAGGVPQPQGPHAHVRGDWGAKVTQNQTRIKP